MGSVRCKGLGTLISTSCLGKEARAEPGLRGKDVLWSKQAPLPSPFEPAARRQLLWFGSAGCGLGGPVGGLALTQRRRVLRLHPVAWRRLEL